MAGKGLNLRACQVPWEFFFLFYSPLPQECPVLSLKGLRDGDPGKPTWAEGVSPVQPLSLDSPCGYSISGHQRVNVVVLHVGEFQKTVPSKVVSFLFFFFNKNEKAESRSICSMLERDVKN